MKKKLENDIGDLESGLEHANAANLGTQKTIKQYQGQIREAQARLEDEQRAKDVIRDRLIEAERRANSVQNALEEARTLLEQSDRARRITEAELSDTNEQLSDLTCQNQAIAGAKRKLDSEMKTLHVSFRCSQYPEFKIFLIPILDSDRDRRYQLTSVDSEARLD